MGLAVIATREEELFFDTLKAQVVDWRTAESLLARAERLSDAVRVGGLQGFEAAIAADLRYRSEEHTSELQSLMRISYAVFCLTKKKNQLQSTTCRLLPLELFRRQLT